MAKGSLTRIGSKVPFSLGLPPLASIRFEQAIAAADALLRGPFTKAEVSSIEHWPKSQSVQLALYPLRVFPSELARLRGVPVLQHPAVNNAFVNLFSISRRGPGRANPDPLTRFSWDELLKMDALETEGWDGYNCTVAEMVLAPETEDLGASREAADEIARVLALSKRPGGYYTPPRTHQDLRTLLTYERLREKYPEAKKRRRVIADANGISTSAVESRIKDARKLLRTLR